MERKYSGTHIDLIVVEAFTQIVNNHSLVDVVHLHKIAHVFV